MGHFYFSFRESGQHKNPACSVCKTKLVLVCFGEYGEVDYEDADKHKLAEEDREVHVGELTGHYCLKCEHLVSLCLNDRESA